MSQMNYNISFDLASVLEVSRQIDKTVFPLLNQAVGAVAQQLTINWQKSVYAAKLWMGEKDAYAKSISWTMTGDFKAVVEATYDKAQEIEDGRPARDLKKMLATSLKVRISKTGSRYLYIPFRHGTPGTNTNPMPAHVYKAAKNLEASKIVGQTTRLSGTGAMDVKTRTHLTVPQSVYKWGGKLPEGMTPKLKPEHKTDIHTGMYRFDTSTPGGAKSSAYLTFRTMSEKSRGWIIPAQPGQHIARNVVEEMKPKAEAVFREAIKRTLS